MKSNYSNTKMDEKESIVLDNVDILYSTEEGNVPPILPIREERQTDGFEMVYDTKGIGSSRSRVVSALENLSDDDTDANFTFDENRNVPNMPNNTNDVIQSLNRTISNIIDASDLADEQKYNSVVSRDKISDLYSTRGHQMTELPLREETQTDGVELILCNDTEADKYFITNCYEQTEATLEILETSKLIYLEELWKIKKVWGNSSLARTQGNTFMRKSTGSKNSNDLNKGIDENLRNHEEIFCDLSIESESLQSLNSIRTGKTRHHYGYKCIGESSEEYEEVAKNANLSFESKESYNSTNYLIGINADIESDLSENSTVDDCRYRNILANNIGDQTLSFDSIDFGIVEEETKDRIVADSITSRIAETERADSNADSESIRPFIEDAKSSINTDEVDNIFSIENSCHSLHCNDSLRIANSTKIDDIQQMDTQQYAVQKSDTDVTSNDISRMQHNNTAETDDMNSASHSVETTDTSKPEIEKDDSRKCILNRRNSANDQNIESVGGPDTIPREIDVTEELGNSSIQINQQARDDDASQYSQKSWNRSPNFFTKHLLPTRIEKMSKKQGKETYTQLVSKETRVVEGIKSQNKGYKRLRYRPSVKSTKVWEPRKNDVLIPQAQFGIQVFGSTGINSGEFHI
jgi:hypothetical protein